jgi:hypothetical protein
MDGVRSDHASKHADALVRLMETLLASRISHDSTGD